jgi:menaquinone C8-methyltransferase
MEGNMITNILRVLFTRSFEPLTFTNKPVYEEDMEVEELGIYVHIPFCTTLCSFCPYNKVEYSEELVKRYKKALIKEINMSGKLYKNKRINSVYFGGGTPALMLEDLKDIIGALKENFSLQGSIGIELHPTNVDEYCLEKLRSSGFDMVSIGIQSFQSKFLSSLGREYVDGAEKVRLAKEAGFKVIDVDLIFGMQQQEEEDLRRDFLSAFEAGATQVSTYPFIDFSYADNKGKPLGRKEKKQLLECLEETSSQICCDRTSVWTFGKYDTQKYSSITRDMYIGFGPSAATLTKKVFQVNTFSVEQYIACVNGNRLPAALTLRFTGRTRALYWLFWNAYTLKLNSSEFHKLFNKKLEEVFYIELKLGRLLGLLKKIPEGYELTKRGAYIYHLLEQRYTHQYIDKTWRITREEPWPKEIKLY